MKSKRQSKVIEIIRENDIETQEELSEMLKGAGFDVTQATVSRDIRELKLTKVVRGDGTSKYEILTKDNSDKDEKFITILKQAIIRVDYAQNMVIVKTLEGMAMAVAAALDAMNSSEIMGTIAGDDNIFCVVKTEEKSIKLVNRIKNLVNS